MSHRPPRAKFELKAQSATPKGARMQELALVPEQMQAPRMRTRGRTATQSLGADGDFTVKKWSKKHMANVEMGRVDKASAKGIWHKSEEAWAGIDDVFPTDTPYSFELDHVDRGDAAKMASYIDHVRTALSALDARLAKGHSPTAAQPLRAVVENGKAALDAIEREVREGDVKGDAKSPSFRTAVAPQLSQLVAPASAGPVQAAAAAAASGPERRVARAWAARVASLEAAGPAGAGPAGRSESCSLCIQVFGCPDCCEPVCGPEGGPGRGGKGGDALRRAGGGEALAGAYGPESDDEAGHTLTDRLRDVMRRLSAARAAEARWRRRYAAAAAAARSEGREIRELERGQIAAAAAAAGGGARAVPGARGRAGEMLRMGDVTRTGDAEVVTPFYELPGQGARRAVSAYERRRREVAALGALGAGFPVLATD